MAEENENPFEQPYRQEQTPTPPSPFRSRQQPHALTIPSTPTQPDSHGSEELQTGSSSAGLPTDTAHATGKTPRRVQWPAELSHHVSVTMASPTSPRNLEDMGAQDALDRALAEHSRNPEQSTARRYIYSNQPSNQPSASGSEAGSRAESTDGDNDERMAEMRDGMEIFVAPGETEGLPNVAGPKSEARSARQAWNLVRAYNKGSYGFMRHRKNAGFKSGLGEGANIDDSKPSVDDEEKAEGGDSEEKPTGGGVANFFRNLASNEAPDQVGEATAPANPAGGGILSALIALQQQQNAGDTSTLASTGSSPMSSRAPSRRNSFEVDEDEDEAERIKFITKQRQKRAARGTWEGASAAVVGVGKSALGGVGQAGHALGFGTHHHHSAKENSKDGKGHRRSESGPSSKGSPLTTWVSRSTSHLPPPEPPQVGLSVPHKLKSTMLDSTTQHLKKLGHTLGLEVETSMSRPEAARSGAGVFGGLMLSTGNIAGIATPAASKLAPQASRPGYHLSRYSAPDINPKPERPRSWYETSRPPSRVASGDDLQQLKHHSTGSNSRASTPPLGSPGLPDSKPSNGPKHRNAFSLSLKDLPTPATLQHKFGLHTRPVTPGAETPRVESAVGDSFLGHKETQEERERREWEKEKRRRKKVKDKRKQEEVFITMHVAAILARQEFIMKMARSFMMFGAPSHRLEAQIQATARVLEINCQAIYLPGIFLISFGDPLTHTSEIKFLKQANGLDLSKLLAAYYVYWKVIHDKISVTDASIELDRLMIAPPKYKLWQQLIIGGIASAAIQPSAFYGSFIDCLVAIPLGSLLVLVQVVVSRNDLYSSLFEIVIACINSFLAAALASTHHFCFAAVASGSVVLILPGYIVLCGSLELANRSIISGSVRLVYSILYSLFLGFGLAMGGEIYQRITGLEISGATDFTCSALRVDAPWYRAVIPKEVYFLSIPLYLLVLGLRNGQSLWRKETPIMLVIGSAGFASNYYAGKAFVNRSDISSAIGSFVVGFLGNVYGKFTRGSPFVVMVVGVLLQLPSGLSNGGLLNFASDDNSTDSYSAGFNAAESLVQVAIGLTVGLFVSAAIVNFAGGGRRRGSNLSSF